MAIEDRTYVTSSDSNAAWGVTIVVVLALIVLGFFLLMNSNGLAPMTPNTGTQPTTNIIVPPGSDSSRAPSAPTNVESNNTVIVPDNSTTTP